MRIFQMLPSYRFSLASKIYLVVTAILLVTLAFFVTLDYLQEREALIRAKVEQLNTAAALTRTLLETAPLRLAFERLRQHAFSESDAAFSVYVVKDGSVVATSNQKASQLERLRRLDWVTEGEVWETSSGLAVSIPYGSSSSHASLKIVVEGKARSVREALRRTLEMHVVHGLVTVAAMALGVGWVLQRAVLAPVRQILSAINIVERGTWKVEVPNGRRDEIGQLTKAFHRMGHNLDQTVRQLVQAEKLSLLALLAIQVERKFVAPLLEIEESASLLDANEGQITRESQREVNHILRATRQARRAMERLDETFFDTLSRVQAEASEAEHDVRVTAEKGAR